MFALKIFKSTRLKSINLKLLNKQLIHSSNIQFIKKVHDSEYEFFSKHVCSSREIEKFNVNIGNFNGDFKKSLNLSKNQSENSVENLLVELEFFANSKSSIKFEKFSDSFHKTVENLQHFTDDQLINLLEILQRIVTETAEYRAEDSFKDDLHNVLTQLDEICCERGRIWSQHQLLKACHLWFKTKFYSKFIEGALSKLRRGFLKLPKDIFIETLFYLTTCRRNIPLTFLEVRMNGMFDELTTNEIGIFCMSLYKNDVWIKEILTVHKLYDKAFAEIESIAEITLQYFLKQLRVSSEPDHVEKLKKLCDVLLHKIDHYSLKTCLYIGLLGTNSGHCHQKLIEAVVNRFNKEIDQAIVKNFTELTFMLSHFNFKTESGIEKELMTKIIKELKLRVDEVVKVPRSLPIVMNNLAMCGIHDDEIMKTVLTEKFYRFAYGE